MELEIDWGIIKSNDEFYDYILPKLAAPDWHGRNLNALNDSVVTGGIYESGPPFNVKHINCSKSIESIRELQVAVISIFTSSVIENGGRQIVQE
jgi:RNAse (barnase) inhibitor barstar